MSLVSLPNFDINTRANLSDEKYMNKITKGVYELGSIFKTFTIALALENEVVERHTTIKKIPRSIKCSKHQISDIKEFPENLSVEDILVRSSNIGTPMIARKVGEEIQEIYFRYKIAENPEIQLEELGNPLKSIE